MEQNMTKELDLSNWKVIEFPISSKQTQGEYRATLLESETDYGVRLGEVRRIVVDHDQVVMHTDVTSFELRESEAKKVAEKIFKSDKHCDLHLSDLSDEQLLDLLTIIEFVGF